MTLFQKAKNAIWKCITPIFPFGRDLLVRSGLIRNPTRQNFHLGWLAPGTTHEEFRTHVAKSGFGNHFVAWIDPDETMGLRKRDSFDFQYHLRLFKDGEIRGHYEWTPESHPYRHFYDIGMQAKTEDFLRFLGDFVVQERPAEPGNMTSQTAPAALRTGPRNG